jgi:ATP/maltotriose-dependent transcriptional regulator MalT
LLGQGLTNKAIAERLFITPETLRWHVRNLYGKTRVQGRDKLIRYANEVGDIGPLSEDKPSTPGNREMSKVPRFS